MMISYAQNFEDVILWRALKHVEKGVYVDIGAQDPVVDSISMAFYEAGWRGVHVEPVRAYADKLRQARPDEEVLEAAIGVERGDLTFFEMQESGLSTGDAEIARNHEAAGLKINVTTVRSVPLSDVLARFEERDVHWLKIDAEGMERSVIESWSPSRVRPWIVVVESTLPNSQQQNFEQWEPTLLTLGYSFVYFDGLNRFYVSKAYASLAAVFGPGPNVFDAFALSGLAQAPFCSKVLGECTQMTEELSALSTSLAETASELAKSEATLSAERQELNAARSDLANVQSRFDTNQAELSQALDALARTKGDLDNVAATCQALQTELAALQATLDLRQKETEVSHRDEIALRRLLERYRRQASRTHDDFVSIMQGHLLPHIDTLGKLIEERGTEVERLNRELVLANTEVQRASAEVDLIRSSTSWRITEPLRSVVDGARTVGRWLTGRG